MHASITTKDQILKGSVRRAMDVIGDRWTLLIILGAFRGFERFDDWLNNNGMSSSVLTTRLQLLLSNKILEKEKIDGSRRFRYVLTERGWGLFPWLLAVWHWENRWIYQSQGHPVSLVHSGCGQVTIPNFSCKNCKGDVRQADVIVEKGPGFDLLPRSQTNVSKRSIVTMADGKDGGSLGQIVDIIGDRWSYLVLAASFSGVRRFDEFQSLLEIAPNILVDRLRRLENNALFARHLYQSRPERWEYIQTEKTMDFYLVPLMLGLWNDRWLSPKEKIPILRFHKTCGAHLEILHICSSCEEVLNRDNTVLTSNDYMRQNLHETTSSTRN